ncbi:MAG: hypothetical protein IJD47_02800 [Clostridia bacterium]|nr:hypothetical protein [Clostridia bacterium]MBQ9125669.1 hypothetical protein [Clostridia bacterium]
MTVKELAKILGATTVAESDFEREINGGYAGDLLSFVMGRAMPDCAWYTIMTNVNVCAVATLTDCAVVVICEDCIPDEMLVTRAKSQGINVIATSLDMHSAIALVAKNC